ncbi:MULTISPECIES: thermonuclease family protein [unclassified Rhizobium]|jgi:endonuclease YncB( thermonuclease family)|uniref:thermonuclease family protein n=1 Tax=unclassified Rhizobium TaxID=2613769 RepID=UPI0006456FFB|nr:MULTISPECIES: thermonuclease family protein [unclassified Rhizobium]MBN8950102.1 hypothetical protein [Rhizobium tropici]OJY62543.1 MAG: hypothetical protein BGP09_15675 [Rhizobium sp. 60-20]RKD74602.1 hypothetical protein BJ928_101955 [Rhizobium sp. WW_1]
MRRDIWLAGVGGAIVGSWLTLIVVQLGEHGFSLPHRSTSNTMTENKPAAAAPTEAAKVEPTPAKAVETPKPLEPAKKGDTNSAEPQPETKPAAQVASAAPETATQSAATPSSTASDSDNEPSAAAIAAAAAATPAPTSDDTAKTPGSDSAKAQENTAAAEPVPSSESKVPTDPARSADASKPEDTHAAPADTQAAAATPDTVKSGDTAPAQASQPAATAPDKVAAGTPETPAADQAKTDPAPDNRVPADQIDREMAAAAHQTLPPQPQQQAQHTPPSEQAALEPASTPQEKTTTVELTRPFSDQAGVVTISGRSVQLAGVVPTDIGRMCTGPSGKDWPCGQAARTAFRMYLRGRSIDCDVADANWKGTITGACRYVRVDLSAWLVRFGWADPEPGSPLASLVDEAKQKKRGMYGDDPRKNGKSTLAPPLPKDNPLNPI